MIAKKQDCHFIAPADKQINEEMVHPTSPSRLQKLEVIQNKDGRVALGANRYVSVEAIRGDMGWEYI